MNQPFDIDQYLVEIGTGGTYDAKPRAVKLASIAEVKTDERSESRSKAYFDYTKQAGGNAWRKEKKRVYGILFTHTMSVVTSINQKLTIRIASVDCYSCCVGLLAILNSQFPKVAFEREQRLLADSAEHSNFKEVNVQFKRSSFSSQANRGHSTLLSVSSTVPIQVQVLSKFQ